MTKRLLVVMVASVGFIGLLFYESQQVLSSWATMNEAFISGDRFMRTGFSVDQWAILTNFVGEHVFSAWCRGMFILGIIFFLGLFAFVFLSRRLDHLQRTFQNK